MASGQGIDNLKRPLILAVDDERCARDLISASLRSINVELVLFSSADGFHQAVRTQRPDAILLDWRMPDASGVDLCRELRAYAPEVPVIFISSESRPEMIHEALSAGAQLFLTKPIAPDQIRKNVECVLQGSSSGPSLP